MRPGWQILFKWLQGMSTEIMFQPLNSEAMFTGEMKKSESNILSRLTSCEAILKENLLCIFKYYNIIFIDCNSLLKGNVVINIRFTVIILRGATASYLFILMLQQYETYIFFGSTFFFPSPDEASSWSFRYLYLIYEILSLWNLKIYQKDFCFLE